MSRAIWCCLPLMQWWMSEKHFVIKKLICNEDTFCLCVEERSWNTLQAAADKLKLGETSQAMIAL